MLQLLALLAASGVAAFLALGLCILIFSSFGLNGAAAVAVGAVIVAAIALRK
jgi:hypothetical protein